MTWKQKFQMTVKTLISAKKNLHWNKKTAVNLFLYESIFKNTRIYYGGKREIYLAPLSLHMFYAQYRRSFCQTRIRFLIYVLHRYGIESSIKNSTYIAHKVFVKITMWSGLSSQYVWKGFRCFFVKSLFHTRCTETCDPSNLWTSVE